MADDPYQHLKLRQEQIFGHLATIYDMLSRLENARIVVTDTIEKFRLDEYIKRYHKEAESYKTELAELQNELKKPKVILTQSNQFQYQQVSRELFQHYKVLARFEKDGFISNDTFELIRLEKNIKVQQRNIKRLKAKLTAIIAKSKQG